MDLPLGIGIAGAGHESHSPLGAVEVIRVGSESREEIELAVAVDINELRAFGVRDRRENVLLPGRFGFFRILQPPGHRARPIDDDQVCPAVAIQIVGKGLKGMAVAEGVVDRGFVSGELHFPIGSGIPHGAGGNVLFAVVIEIPNRDTFAAKYGVEDGPLERDCRGRAGLGVSG